VKLIRIIVMALLGSLLAGLVIGTLIRRQIERPERYIGRARPGLHDLPASAVPAGPLHITDPGAVVRLACQDEEQVGEPVQVANARIG